MSSMLFDPRASALAAAYMMNLYGGGGGGGAAVDPASMISLLQQQAAAAAVHHSAAGIVAAGHLPSPPTSNNNKATEVSKASPNVAALNNFIAMAASQQQVGAKSTSPVSSKGNGKSKEAANGQSHQQQQHSFRITDILESPPPSKPAAEKGSLPITSNGAIFGAVRQGAGSDLVDIPGGYCVGLLVVSGPRN